MVPTEERYDFWNYALVEHCLLADADEGVVQLTVTPGALARALETAGEPAASPAEAERDFSESVASVYRDRVLGGEEGLRSLKSKDPRDVPFCTGFLAVTVLAAFDMRSDADRTGRAYYPRLAKRLKCRLVRNNLPDGFEGDVYLELWDELNAWLHENYERQLPEPASGPARPYVAQPLAHVPLRKVDLDRLPQFFEAHDYEPGSAAPTERLRYDLFDRAGPCRLFTSAGRNALEDPKRRPFVVRQVAQELERWDGSFSDSPGGRTALVELWLDIRRRRAHLQLAARRPDGFPATFQFEGLVFSASQEGWYDPIPIGPNDGRLLLDGFSVSKSLGGTRYSLRCKPTRVIALTPSTSHSGYVSDNVLRAETTCAVFCETQAADQVESYLREIGAPRPRRRTDPTLPKGWTLFLDVRATRTAPPPDGLEHLTVESSVSLVVTGGLRLGRASAWLAGAPPRIRLVGPKSGLTASVDESQAAIEDDGTLVSNALDAPGKHIVAIGNRVRRHITVREGALHPELTPWPPAGPDPFPVPPGNWTLVGHQPGASFTLGSTFQWLLVRPPFQARWAIKVGAGRGATALHLHDDFPAHCPAPESSEGSASASRDWAETIYQAAIRRPHLRCAHGCTEEQLEREWVMIRSLAKLHKRRARRRN